MNDENDPHPIRAAWARYKQTGEFREALKVHDESALWAGFADGWIYGRMRTLSLPINGEGEG